jgi:hypothetical protein
MDNKREESLIERIKDGFSAAIGLPPGNNPDGEPKAMNASNDDAPRKTLTSDDAEGLPPHQGTRIKPIE